MRFREYCSGFAAIVLCNQQSPKAQWLTTTAVSSSLVGLWVSCEVAQFCQMQMDSAPGSRSDLGLFHMLLWLEHILLVINGRSSRGMTKLWPYSLNLNSAHSLSTRSIWLTPRWMTKENILPSHERHVKDLEKMKTYKQIILSTSLSQLHF